MKNLALFYLSAITTLSLNLLQAESVPFERIGPNIFQSYYGSVQIAPDRPDTLYFASRGSSPKKGGKNKGFYLSTDAGKTWRYKGRAGHTVNTPNVGLKTHEATPGLVVTVTEWQPNFWISKDYGETWEKRKAPYKHGISIAIDPKDANIIYVGCDDGIWKTTDQGVTWKSLTAGLPPYVKSPSNTVSQILIHPEDSNTVYLSFLYANFKFPWGIYKSTDAGATWTPINKGLPEGELLLDLTGQKGTAERLNLNQFGLQYRAIKNMVMDPQNPDTLYALTRQSGIYKTTDGGTEWTQIHSGTFEQEGYEKGVIPFSLAVHPKDSKTLIATTSTMSTFISRNEGKDWSLLTRLLGESKAEDGTWSVTYPNGKTKTGNTANNIIKNYSIKVSTPVFSPQDPNTIFLPTDLGIFKGQLPSK